MSNGDQSNETMALAPQRATNIDRWKSTAVTQRIELACTFCDRKKPTETKIIKCCVVPRAEEPIIIFSDLIYVMKKTKTKTNLQLWSSYHTDKVLNVWSTRYMSGVKKYKKIISFCFLYRATGYILV